jgi:hypothetical protein
MSFSFFLQSRSVILTLAKRLEAVSTIGNLLSLLPVVFLVPLPESGRPCCLNPQVALLTLHDY